MVWRGGGGCYLCYVVIKPLQGFLAVDESVAGGFPQFHQEGFLCCQELTTSVQGLHVLANTDLRTEGRRCNTQYPGHLHNDREAGPLCSRGDSRCSTL